jgi:hypothetical protein
VTAPDFGSAEFLGEDWVIISGNEPPAIDLTDSVFSGPAGAQLFAVFPSIDTLGEAPGSVLEVQTPVLAATGSGFVYMKNGVTTLVPATDVMGGTWEP